MSEETPAPSTARRRRINFGTGMKLQAIQFGQKSTRERNHGDAHSSSGPLLGRRLPRRHPNERGGDCRSGFGQCGNRQISGPRRFFPGYGLSWNSQSPADGIAGEFVLSFRNKLSTKVLRIFEVARNSGGCIRIVRFGDAKLRSVEPGRHCIFIRNKQSTCQNRSNDTRDVRTKDDFRKLDSFIGRKNRRMENLLF